MKTRPELHSLSHPDMIHDASAGPAQLNALVLCEDDAHAMPPLQSLQKVLARLPLGLDIHSHVWKFESLHLPVFYETALRQASDCGLIAVAVRGNVELPAAVRSLVTRALTLRMPHPVALVLFADVLSDATQSPCPAARYLKSIASASGAQYFETSLNRPSPAKPAPTPQPPGRRPESRDPQGPSRHWGINE